MSQDLRLRVTVQRHGVPEVKLVWPCARSPDLTVAKLLAQLDEVVPLESGEWGLEDYVVELADGFEVLHFQQITRTLKDEDHVVVRCLMGEELKRRRLNGRHQITADGKHLVDGLVFGRPWLRAPRDRPALELPPRKQARGEGDYDDYHDADDEDQWQEPRLLLEGVEMPVDDDESFVDFEQDWDEIERTDDETVEEPSDDEEALAEELRLLREDNEAVGQDSSAENLALASTGTGPGQGAVPNSPLDLGLLDGIVALRAAFPLTPATTIEAELVRQHKDINKAYRALKTANDPALSFDEMMDQSVMGLLDASEMPSVEHAEGGKQKRPLIQVVESDDGDTESSRDGSPNPGPGPQQAESRTPAGDETDDGPRDSDDTSSSGTSGSDYSADGNGDGDGSGENRTSDNSTSDDSTSDDSSSDDSASDDSSSDDSGSDGSSDSDNGVPVGNRAKANGRGEASKGTKGEPQKVSAPGLGLTLTQKRNARRRRTKARMKSEQEQGAGVEAQTLEERKTQLLRLLAVDPDAAKDTQEAQETGAEEMQQENGDADDAGPRRARIDVGAGRRLLFGALGLRAPKTKADEEKIKQGLMKGVRPLMNVRLADGNGGGDQEAEAEAEPKGGDEWRQKITYRAVECCDEGVVLSEPPFPFKQRWDLQQQGTTKGKRKRTPAQEYYEGMYDDDASGPYVEEEPHVEEEDGGRGRRVRRRKTATNGMGQEEDAAETAAGQDGAKRRKLLPAAAGRFAGAEDLPVPPADVSGLAELEAGGAKEGMVVTWKQMVMSKATQWQPQIVQRTGLVLGADDEELRVLLAVRDRGEEDKEYDATTGKRIYSKFEVPASESEGEGGEGGEGGEMGVPWGEVMDARMVEGEPPDEAP